MSTEARDRPAGRADTAGAGDGDNKPIAHVLLVAGARAAGKSTFLEQLWSGRLPKEVDARIPVGASRWPRFLAGHHLLWRPLVWSRAHRDRLWRFLPRRLRPTHDDLSFVLHYDLQRFARAGFEDPPLAVVRLARGLTVVIIRPPVDRLIGQYEWRRSHRMLRLGSGKRPSRTRELYDTKGWVDELYSRWIDAVARELAPQAAIRWLEIEPVASGPHKSWRIRGKAGH